MHSPSHALLSKVVCTCLVVSGLSFGTAQGLPSHAEQAQPRQSDEKGPATLTKDDVELIRVYEVDLNSDPPPRVSIPRDVLSDFLTEFKEDDRVPRGKSDQMKWIRDDGHKQLALMFELRARDYYSKVRIRSTIPALKEWGAVHRRYVLGYFQEQFGENKVPGLYLLPKAREIDLIEMTNFYILTQVQVDGKWMIDRQNPTESLLLQWGLPREEAKFAAPDDIEGWRPYFRNADDKRFKDIANWINSLHKFNQGSDYGISYTIPGTKSEEEPAAN